MEDHLRQVAVLNARGVYCLVAKKRKNRIPKAVRSFKAALAVMQAAQEEASSSAPHRPQYLQAYSSAPVVPMQNKNQQVEDVASSDSDSYYVFNRAIFFKPLSDMSAVGLIYYTAVLHYNLALAYHCEATAGVAKASSNEGKKTTLTQAAALSRARKHYKQALEVLTQAGIFGKAGERPPHPGGGELLLYLRLSALNNMAHVHRLSHQYSKMRTTLRRVFQYTLAHRATFFAAQDDTAQQSNKDHNNSAAAAQANGLSSITHNQTFVHEVLLNVMVTQGPVVGAGAA